MRRRAARARALHCIGTARLAAEGAHLIGQLLDLRGQRAHLRLEAIEAHAVGAAAAVAAAASGGGCATAAATGERFERADHDLHVDELLLELLDALLQSRSRWTACGAADFAFGCAWAPAVPASASTAARETARQAPLKATRGSCVRNATPEHEALSLQV